jgi:hypothetical protein
MGADQVASGYARDALAARVTRLIVDDERPDMNGTA